MSRQCRLRIDCLKVSGNHVPEGSSDSLHLVRLVMVDVLGCQLYMAPDIEETRCGRLKARIAHLLARLFVAKTVITKSLMSVTDPGGRKEVRVRSKLFGWVRKRRKPAEYSQKRQFSSSVNVSHFFRLL